MRARILTLSILVFPFTFFACENATAPVIGVQGVVVGVAGQPIADAQVTIAGESTVTDPSGNFNLDNVEVPYDAHLDIDGSRIIYLGITSQFPAFVGPHHSARLLARATGTTELDGLALYVPDDGDHFAVWFDESENGRFAVRSEWGFIPRPSKKPGTIFMLHFPTRRPATWTYARRKVALSLTTIPDVHFARGDFVPLPTYHAVLDLDITEAGDPSRNRVVSVSPHPDRRASIYQFPAWLFYTQGTHFEFDLPDLPGIAFFATAGNYATVISRDAPDTVLRMRGGVSLEHPLDDATVAGQPERFSWVGRYDDVVYALHIAGATIYTDKPEVEFERLGLTLRPNTPYQWSVQEHYPVQSIDRFVGFESPLFDWSVSSRTSPARRNFRTEP